MDKAARLRALYDGYAEEPMLQEVRRGRPPVMPCGPPDSPLAVVGEAPGEAEEREGRPFCGPSGQLLARLFAAAQIPWELCYVTNVLPWRPPGNREPYPFEVMESWDRLAAEIGIVGPKVVVAAGNTAWHGITRNALGRFPENRYHLVESSRGPFPYDLLAIHHPSWVLRQGRDREESEQAIVRALRAIFG